MPTETAAAQATTPFRSRLLAFGLGFLIIMLAVQPAFSATIQTDLWVYQQGDTVTVSGADYGSGETVEIVTTDPNGVEVDRGAASADELGGFTYQFVLMSDVPGIYDVVGTGQNSGLRAATQFDPPNFTYTFDSPSATVQYSDIVTFTGTYRCVNGGGGSPNCPTTAISATVTIALRSGGGGFVDVATGTSSLTFASTASGCPSTCSIPWSVTWQAGRNLALGNVAPGTYDARTTVSSSANFGSQQTLNNAVTITKEQTTATYGGATSGTTGTSLSLSASVADFDGGAGSGNGRFMPDTNLAGTNVVTFQLFNAANTVAVSGVVSANTNSSGATTGSPALTLPAAGTYQLRTTYLGNTFYLNTSDLDQITVTSADGSPPLVTLTLPSVPSGQAGYFNGSQVPVAGSVSATDPAGVTAVNCTDSAGGLTLGPLVSGSRTVSISGNGTHNISCSATDGLGNSGAASGSTNTATVNIDASDPVTSATPSRGPDSNGWYNHAFSVHFSAVDVGPSANVSCDADANYNGPDSSAGSITGSCRDAAGNADSATFSFKYDGSAPHDVTGTPDRAPNANGWYNAPVLVTFTGVDDLSGVDFCSSTTYSGLDDGAASVAGTCTDKAGNVGNGSFGLKYDETDPTVAISFVPASPDGDNGWYVSDVQVTLTSNDNLSGVDLVEYTLDGGATWDTYTAPFTVHDDGEYTVDARVFDKAGNQGTDTADLDVDQTDPTITLFTRVPVENLNGWNNTDVTLTWACADDTSGVVNAFVSNTEAAEGLDSDSTQTCEDNAGNTASATEQVSIDKTAPHDVTGTPDRAPNANGWYNAPVLVTFTGVDDLSGVDFCSSTTYSGLDDGAASVAGTCTDKAGNVGNGSFGLKYDETDPTVAISFVPASPDGDNGWYVSDVQVTLTSNDNLSGVDLVEYTLDGGATWDTYTAPFTVHDDGEYTVDARVFDKAGNQGTDTADLDVDQTDPTVAISFVPASPDGDNGWYVSDVQVTLTSNDNLSGVDLVEYTLDGGATWDTYTAPFTVHDDGEYTVDARVFDKAGNQGTDTADLDVDQTDPTITFSSRLPTANANGWNNTDVTVTWTCTDATSGPFEASVFETVSDEGAGQFANASCLDNAGNSSGTDSVGGISIDKTAPVITNEGPTTSPNLAGWYNTDVTNVFKADDSLSGLNASCLAAFPDAGHRQSKTTSTEGMAVHVTSNSCTDVADNTAAAINSADFKIDKTAPVITNEGPTTSPNLAGWYNTDVTNVFKADDSLSGLNASCLAAFPDAGHRQSKTTSTEGMAVHVTSNSCTDVADNTAAAINSADFKIDKTAPVITNEGPTTSPNLAGWYNTDVTNVFKADDSLSGLNASCLAAFPDAGHRQSKTTSTEGMAVHVTSNSCTDVADNTAAAINSADFKIDKTAPVITNEGPTTSPNLAGWYNTDVTNVFKADDSLSGLNASCLAAFPDAGHRQSKTTSTEGMAVHVTSNSCTDVADNTAAAINSADFKIDKTAPVMDITSPADGSSTIALTIAVSGTSADGLSGLSYVKVNGLPATAAAGSFSAAGVPLSCGSNTITAMVADIAGNSASDTIHVTRICFGNVQYYQPLDQSTSSMAHPVTNSGKMGRVIPTKVTFKTDDGSTVTDIVAAARGWTIIIGVNGASCDNGAAIDSVEAYADAGQSNAGTNLFRWTSGQWMYNLDTGKPPQVTMTINACYRLDVYVYDGTTKVKVSADTFAIFKPTK